MQGLDIPVAIFALARFRTQRAWKAEALLPFPQGVYAYACLPGDYAY